MTGQEPRGTASSSEPQKRKEAEAGVPCPPSREAVCVRTLLPTRCGVCTHACGRVTVSCHSQRGPCRTSWPPLPGAHLPPKPDRYPGQRVPTWRAEAEGIGRAEAAATDPGSEGDLVLSWAGLVLAGGGHQASVGVQLDEEPVLQHPHHHLDELGLQGRQGEAWAWGGRPTSLLS